MPSLQSIMNPQRKTKNLGGTLEIWVSWALATFPGRVEQCITEACELGSNYGSPLLKMKTLILKVAGKPPNSIHDHTVREVSGEASVLRQEGCIDQVMSE